MNSKIEGYKFVVEELTESDSEHRDYDERKIVDIIINESMFNVIMKAFGKALAGES